MHLIYRKRGNVGMNTITISTENKETYSAISNLFIDHYMTDANGEYVKIYLYLVRLMQGNSAITIANIADHFNLTESDICRAIKYWISKDVLKLNYDGGGKLKGIVLLPLRSPSDNMLFSEDDISILNLNTIKSNNQTLDNKYIDSKKTDAKRISNDVTVTNKSSSNNHSNVIALTVPLKPSYSKNDVTNKMHDDNFSDIIFQMEAFFNRTLTWKDTETLMYIYDTLNFSVDLIECLIEYCASQNVTTSRYMEAVAIAWFEDGVKDRTEAKKHTNRFNPVLKVVYKYLGINRSMPTNIETTYINTWCKDYGYDARIVEEACNRAVTLKPSSANFAYINAIIDNWHKNNVKNLDDIKELDKDFANNKAKKNLEAVAPKISTFGNFKQTKMDDAIDEMEKLLLKEVNK